MYNIFISTNFYKRFTEKEISKNKEIYFRKKIIYKYRKFL